VVGERRGLAILQRGGGGDERMWCITAEGKKRAMGTCGSQNL